MNALELILQEEQQRKVELEQENRKRQALFEQQVRLAWNEFAKANEPLLNGLIVSQPELFEVIMVSDHRRKVYGLKWQVECEGILPIEILGIPNLGPNGEPSEGAKFSFRVEGRPLYVDTLRDAILESREMFVKRDQTVREQRQMELLTELTQTGDESLVRKLKHLDTDEERIQDALRRGREARARDQEYQRYKQEMEELEQLTDRIIQEELPRYRTEMQAYRQQLQAWVQDQIQQLWSPWQVWQVRYVPRGYVPEAGGMEPPVFSAYVLEGPESWDGVVTMVDWNGETTKGVIGHVIDAQLVEFKEPQPLCHREVKTPLPDIGPLYLPPTVSQLPVPPEPPAGWQDRIRARIAQELNITDENDPIWSWSPISLALYSSPDHLSLPSEMVDAGAGTSGQTTDTGSGTTGEVVGVGQPV